jgi:acetyl-CoA carboxylase biotin carboxyl carrier protein
MAQELRSKSKFSEEELNKLINLLNTRNVSEIAVEYEGLKLKVKKNLNAPVSIPDSAPAADQAGVGAVHAKASAEQATQPVISKNIGMFHYAKNIKVGVPVKKAQVIGSVIAMNIENQVQAEIDGEIAELLVKENQPVEYGQELLRLKSA